MKQRIRITSRAGARGLFGAPVPATVVVDEKPGQVGLLDKAKRYYKEAITAVGVLALALQDAAPVYGDQRWFTIAIAVVTVAGVVLKDNEHWVNGAGR